MVEEKKRRGRPPGSKNKTGKKAEPSKIEAGSRLKDEVWAIVILALGIFFGCFTSDGSRWTIRTHYIKSTERLLRNYHFCLTILSDFIWTIIICETHSTHQQPFLNFSVFDLSHAHG